MDLRDITECYRCGQAFTGRNCPSCHPVRLTRERGFQPPWYTVLVFQCPAGGAETRLRVSHRGGGPGAIFGNCGHLIHL